jgi:decaprenylphospho-beta-D-ribofuranose 2-oxidase
VSRLAGWGGFPVADCALHRPGTLAKAMQEARAADDLIARGAGRAYGDAALNPALTLDMTVNSRLLAFDEAAGVIACEAGLMLSDLIAVAGPRGWFPPVTPGTQFVTIGGMVAADVHGKNHHVDGSIGRYVRSLTLLTGAGAVVECSPQSDPELFFATIGGMGLTGVILEVSLALRPVSSLWIRQEVTRTSGLDETLAVMAASAQQTYSVAWVDCLAKGESLGRAIVSTAEHASAQETQGLAAPVPRRGPTAPPIPVNLVRTSGLRLFNAAYYGLNKPGSSLVPYDAFFYPLDRIGGWNRLYGPGGFFQHQCVIPAEAGAEGARRLLQEVAAAGTGSFLSVLKLLGEQGQGLLSFPRPGVTVAMDFPCNPANFALADRLDAVVLDLGGRLYLAKDSRMSAALFRQTYPNLEQFQAIRRRVDPAGKFRSSLSQRLGLT